MRNLDSPVYLEYWPDEGVYVIVGTIHIMSGHFPHIDLSMVSKIELYDLAWCLEELAGKIQEAVPIYSKGWNCLCRKPKPDGKLEVGKFEGRYQRCKVCDKRIWN